jgi:chromosome segregation ATPase
MQSKTMALYRCIQKGDTYMVFDRAGNPAFKTEGRPRSVMNYDTNTMVDLPADRELTCVSVNAKPSICTQFNPQECNAFSDFCQSYNYMGTRRCRLRGMSFKSLSALQRCQKDKEDLLTEIAQVRSQLATCDNPDTFMDRPAEAAAAQMQVTQLQAQLAELHATLEEVQEEKVQLLRQVVAAREESLAQAREMHDGERATLLARMTADLQAMERSLETVRREKADLEQSWRDQLAALLAEKDAQQAELQRQLDAVRTEKRETEEGLRATYTDLSKRMGAEQAALQQALDEVRAEKRDIELRASQDTFRADQATLVAQMNAEQAALQQQLQSLRDERRVMEEQLRAEHATMMQQKNAEQAELEAAIAKVNEDKRVMQEDLQTTRADLRLMEQARQQSEEEKDTMSRAFDAERGEREARMAGLRTELATAQDTITGLQQTLTEVREQAAAQRDQFDEVQGEYDLARQDKAALQAQLQEAVAKKTEDDRVNLQQRTELKERLAALQDQYDDVSSRQADTEPEYLKNKEELREIKVAYQALKAAHATMQADQEENDATFQREMKEWEAKRRELNATVREKEDEILRLQGSLEDSTRAISNLESSIEQLMSKTRDIIGYDKFAELAASFGIREIKTPASYSGEVAVRRRRNRSTEKSIKYVMDLLKEVIYIIREAHRNDMRRRKRGSGRR